MPERRLKLLFVITHLVQGGSERFTYEVCAALHQRGFDIELLTKSLGRRGDYYYEKIRALGIPIHRRLPIWLGRLQRRTRFLFLAARPLLEFVHRLHARLLMGRLLDRFDVINVIQIENYHLLQPLLEDNDRIITYLMSSAFQYSFDPYEDCRSGRIYRFVLTDPTQRDDYRHAPCAGAATFHLPLTLDLSSAPDLSRTSGTGPPHDIGVFIRLSPERPMNGLFQAFARLLETTDATLRIWGRGNPARFTEQLERLKIIDRVVFAGHTSSIEHTIRHAGLSIVWMTCHGPTIGYASVEVGCLGFPMLFWNLGPSIPDAEVRRQTRGAVRAYQHPDELAEATRLLLGNRLELDQVGSALRNYIRASYGIEKHIARLEVYIRSSSQK